MADLSNAFWSETDASNNNASPNGWPEGMMPSGVNDAARADKGALKRFWNRINPVQRITSAGGVWSFVTSNASYPTAYVDGESFVYIAVSNSATGDQFRVNSLAAKPIYTLRPPSTYVPIGVADIIPAQPVTLVYQSGLNAGAGGFFLLNPSLPLWNSGSGAAATYSTLTVNGAGTAALNVPGGGITTAYNLTAATGSFSGAISAASGTISSLTVNGGGTALNVSAGNLNVAAGGTFGGGITITANGFAVNGGNATFAGVVTIAAGGTAFNVSAGNIYVAGGGTFGGGITIAAGGFAVNGGNATFAGAVNITGDLTARAAAFSYSGGGYALDCSGGSMHVAGSITTNGDVVCQNITANVQGYKPAGGSWASISDVRTKEADIADYTRGLDAVMRLRPVSYRYNGRGGMPRDGRTFVGLVADDVLPVMPEMVGTITEKLDPGDDEPTDILTLDTTALTFVLLNAVKALAAEVAALKEK